MTANMDESDAPLRDQPTRKPFTGAQQLGRLTHGQEPP
jgi:hypothetical protein